MSRVRWYHFYFALALFDVVVILLSLQTHGRTIASVTKLISETGDLDEQSRWLQHAQQRVLELNAPGNDLFRLEDFKLQARRFETAKRNMAEVFSQSARLKIPIDLPSESIAAMIAAAEELFDEFEKVAASELPPDEHRQAIARAGLAMARMDAHQHATLGALGLVFQRNAEVRDRLLLEHERDLQARVNAERYFIAAVILILVGILWFGRRLQIYDRALQNERRRLQEERRERLAAIGELCSSVAHGIRNPLAAIRSSAQLTLELGQMDEASQHRMRDILDESRRLGDRVTGLLSMARATKEGFAQVNLSEIVARAVRELELAFAERRLVVEKEIADDQVFVLGNRHQLEEMIIELLSNALDHSGSGARVRVYCGRPTANGTATIEVADDGPGVPEDVRNRVFELFFTTKPEGTGIGLATIKRCARLHGGDVTLVTGEKGACFRVKLPVAKNQER